MAVKYLDKHSEQVTTSDVTLYTAPNTSEFQSSQIQSAVVHNVTTANVTLTVNIVQFGGTAGVTNRYLGPKQIYPGRTDALSSLVGTVLQAGDFISVVSDTASSLNLKLGIKEISTDE